MARSKSIILITVDCLRADHCGFMGYPRPTTPFLDGLAGESFAFPAAIVAGGSTYSSFSPILPRRFLPGLRRDCGGSSHVLLVSSHPGVSLSAGPGPRFARTSRRRKESRFHMQR